MTTENHKTKRVASLSLDLDNKWAYMKTHGDPGWQSFPSYLDIVVPRALSFLRERGIRITFFIVGQDAALAKNYAALTRLNTEGHEIGNHSFHHEPWLHLNAESEIEAEISSAEDVIQQATGICPRGFRGPGFSHSTAILRVLARRGYLYDASTFPTFLGPMARAYYFMTAKLDAEEMEKRKDLFGKFREGFRSLKPYQARFDGGSLTEMPVTTMPFIKTPIHVSYLIYLSRFSSALAKAYFQFAVRLCLMTGVGPSLLLHPLDFLGSGDVSELAFFPGMDLPAERKLELLDWVLALYTREFEVMCVGDHVRYAEAERILPAMEITG
jgi:peptidoglycan/xylan/chitin deacetylase (PgdA/CDA1 family)